MTTINPLLEKTELFYLFISELFKWLNDYELLKKDFQNEKKTWEEIKNLSCFFIDTSLLIIEKDIILLETEDENSRENLTKNYQVTEQENIKKHFGEKKHIILLTTQQWKKIKEQKTENFNEKCFVLFKNESIIKNNLKKWLENFNKDYKKL